jgi:hypothetical protein
MAQPTQTGRARDRAELNVSFCAPLLRADDRPTSVSGPTLGECKRATVAP